MLTLKIASRILAVYCWQVDKVIDVFKRTTSNARVQRWKSKTGQKRKAG